MTKNSDALIKRDAAVSGVAQPDPWGRSVAPAADIYETDDAFVVLLDMPGAAKETISVTVERETLTVKAPAIGRHGSGATLLYQEIDNGSYLRLFTLGEGVDAGKIDAQYDAGVLAVKVYKSEAVKPRPISIR
jgi:HSP20 family protein